MSKADAKRHQKIDSAQLNPPSLADVRAVLENGLKLNYQFVEVDFLTFFEKIQASQTKGVTCAFFEWSLSPLLFSEAVVAFLGLSNLEK